MIVAQVGDDAAERRGDAGKARDHRALQPDLPDQRARRAARRRRRTAWRQICAGSWPRSIETRRMAPAMRASATRTIAAAACIRSSPSGAPTWFEIARSRRLDIERLELAADRARGVDAAEHHLGIGQGRPVIALRRSRPGPAPSRRFPGQPATARRGRPRRSSRRRRRWW